MEGSREIHLLAVTGYGRAVAATTHAINNPMNKPMRTQTHIGHFLHLRGGGVS
jgi:hypothetical protein